MAISMSTACLPICTTTLGNLAHILDKAQASIEDTQQAVTPPP
jgi:hypothetical protein